MIEGMGYTDIGIVNTPLDPGMHLSAMPNVEEESVFSCFPYARMSGELIFLAAFVSSIV